MIKCIEICANSFRSALAALNGGADRVELCSVLGVGGVTPSYGAISMVRELGIECNVLIRPRQGDFVYSPDEIEEICRDIQLCADLGVNGVVVGALTKGSRVDRAISSLFLERAKRNNLSVTFHRAIDRSIDILNDTDIVADMGYDRILTSGGEPTAFEGMENIREMVRLVGDRCGIMAGSGVNISNAKEIVQYTGVREIHFSASKVVSSESEYQPGRDKLSFTPDNMGGDYSLSFSDEDTIRKMVSLLRNK